MAITCTGEGRTLYAVLDGELDHHRAREILAELDRQLAESESLARQLAQARGDFLSKLCKGVTQEEFAAFFSMVGKMVDNLGDMPLEDELRLENEFEKGSVKGQ